MKLNPIPWPVTLLERSVRIADWAEFEVPFMLLEEDGRMILTGSRTRTSGTIRGVNP